MAFLIASGCWSSPAQIAQDATPRTPDVPRDAVVAAHGKEMLRAEFEALPLRYTVTAVPPSRQVRVELAASSPTDPLELRLPDQGYRMHGDRVVRDLRARCGRRALTVESILDGHIAVRHHDCREVVVSWTVHMDAGRSAHDNDLLVAHGPSALLLPASEETHGALPVTVIAPHDWTVASNWTPIHLTGNEERQPLSSAKLAWHFLADDPGHREDSVLVGGALEITSRTLGDGRTLQLATEEGLILSSDALAELIDRLVVSQRSYLPAGWTWPRGTSRLSVVVVGSGRRRHLSGGGHRGGFIVELGQGTTNLALAELLAHEAFHVLNGHLLIHSQRAEYGTLWFKEGVTTYVAARSLVAAGLADESWFRQRIGELTANYFSNPQAMQLPAKEVATRFWRDPHARRLPYDKGALIGLVLDVELHRQGVGGLPTLFADLISAFALRGLPYDNASLRATVRQLVDDDSWVAPFWERFVDGVEPLPLRRVLADADLHLVRDTEPAPYFGFRIASDRLGPYIADLDQRGPGRQAGLRIGDRLLETPETGGARQAVDLRVVRAGVVTVFTVQPEPGRRAVFRLVPIATPNQPRYLQLLAGP